MTIFTNEERSAHYREMFDDELTVWQPEDVEGALECGAITEAEADQIAVFDEEEWKRKDAELEAKLRENDRKFALAWLETFGKESVSAGFIAGLVRRGVFTHEEAMELFC